ncbi:hypothetical protein HW555_005182 [Spodoptera exigua]|uniref:Uncharacterized protein n=1 Tax=Spodoptera exigua TaxID=7107 RepID=A0A835L4Q8_SPOEX|nr:hypothetical protein HW555_005182 [Spodoptera exigua]
MRKCDTDCLKWFMVANTLTLIQERRMSLSMLNTVHVLWQFIMGLTEALQGYGRGRVRLTHLDDAPKLLITPCPNKIINNSGISQAQGRNIGQRLFKFKMWGKPRKCSGYACSIQGRGFRDYDLLQANNGEVSVTDSSCRRHNVGAYRTYGDSAASTYSISLRALKFLPTAKRKTKHGTFQFKKRTANKLKQRCFTAVPKMLGLKCNTLYMPVCGTCKCHVLGHALSSFSTLYKHNYIRHNSRFQRKLVTTDKQLATVKVPIPLAL